MSESLRGKLLIASPTLGEPFTRTVVLVVEHGEEGAMGVILNRPSEHRVAEVVPALAELADDDDVVHVGGPVGSHAVVTLGEFDDPGDAAALIVGDLGLIEPARPEDPFEADELWADALTRKGGSYALVARMPPDPSLN